MKIIKKASADYPAVHIDYAESFATMTVIIVLLSVRREPLKNFSGRKAENTNRPGRCRRKHLHQMRHLRHEMPASDYLPKNGGFPQIDAKGCIGCGACQNACPVNAITVIPVETQKIL